MTTPILITGGTGTLGTLVVRRLREAGRDVRVLSRHPHVAEAGVEYLTGDLATGQGIEAAVNGAEIIVHCAGGAKGDDVKARNLVRTSSRAAHLVYISVVGADRIPIVSGVDRAMFGYFGSKRAAELVIEKSGIPFTTLRATQFHDLSLTTVRQISKLPMVPAAAGFRFQPIDADTVAARLVELALGAPAGLVPDLGGPRVYPMAELIRSYLTATHKRRPIVQVRMPGKAAAAIRAGGNLTPARAGGSRTWEEFLADQIGAGAAPGGRQLPAR
jgi:Predicted nucleoside-diphosphate-sugar epimerases